MATFIAHYIRRGEDGGEEITVTIEAETKTGANQKAEVLMDEEEWSYLYVCPAAEQ